MARGPGDSKIPVFSTNPKPLSSRLSRPLANFSNKVRAHLSSESNSKHRSTSTSMILGILGGQSSRKSSKLSRSQTNQTAPQRPSKFFESLNVPELPSESFNQSDQQISVQQIGKKVCVAGQTNGVLRYIGSTEFDTGVWCGVELDGPSGLNDGTVHGVQYFKCPPQHGVLAPVSKVTLVEDVSEKVLNGVLKEKRNSAGARMENGWSEDVTEQIGESKCPSVQSISQISTPTPSSTNSGLPLWEWTLGSQHSSSAGSLVPSLRGLNSSVHDHNISLELSKHSSIDFDESLGILTPDQMTSDFPLSLRRTPSSDDIKSFILQDFEEDKITLRNGSKRSSMEMQCEDSYDAQKVEDKFDTKIEDNAKIEDIETKIEDKFERKIETQMEQDVVKDVSEDTEMSDSHLSKKTSDLAMSVSYEAGTETVSDFVRINRTPSLEDLPMDKVEQKEETSTAGPSRNVLPPPFITSVTSIASLDNGYQGDGEWSRPGSRGADHSPLAHQMAKTKMDPMTDSDFFTESDADMHDEGGAQSGSGTGRGDRRAQIIDGTLYGGVSGGVSNNVFNQDQRFNQNTEEMDSSGIYSDLERKAEEPVVEAKPEVIHDEKDFSPEGSTRTVSSKSENSQRISTAEFTSLIIEQVNTIKNLAVTIPMEAVDMINNWEENKKPKSSQTNTKINTKDENQENRRPVTRNVKTPRKGRWDAVMNKIAQGKAEEKAKPSRLKEVKSKVFAGISLNTPCQPMQGRKACSSRNLTASQSISTTSLRDITSLKSKSRRSRTRGSEGSPATQNSSRNSSLSDVSISIQSQTVNKASPQSLRTSKKRDPVRSTLPSNNDSNTPPSRPSSTPSTMSHRVLPQKNGGVGVVQEMKTSPNLRKQPSRRNFTPPTKPAPLRDLNRVPASSTIGGGKVGVETPRRPQALPSLPPLQKQASVSLDVATTELRHAALGVQALGVLVNYLVFNLEAFSTPNLKKELEKMRADWLRTKLEMEEVRATYIRSEEEKEDCMRRLDEARNQIQIEDEQHRLEISAITNDHDTIVQALETRLSEITEMHQYSAKELERLKQYHIEQTEELKKTAKAELAEKENELKARLTSVMADYNDLKEQSRKMLDSMHSDKDVKLQATAGRCKLLEDEVESLRAVFELRSNELQELRKQNEIAMRDAQQLPAAEQKITTLQARVEDLELQLERKTLSEQALMQEKKLLSESIMEESKKKKRLSQYNEELQWKLKQSSEVFNVLASMSGVADPLSTGSLLIPQTPKAIYTDYITGTPRYNASSTPYPAKDASPPQSPKVKAVVEKSDSVSWVLEMDESPEHIVSRLVRKAHSFRAVQSATPSPAHHCHTLPNPHKRQRCRKSLSGSGVPATKPGRARSFSFDSDTSDVPRKCITDWDEQFSPTRLDMSAQSDDNEELIVVETVGEDRLHSFLDIGEPIDGEKLDIMGGEDFASPKSSSSSGRSEVSMRSKRKENTLIDNEEIMMINRVDSLLSSLPKESAGEAMISEDTSDNESGSRDSEDDERFIF